MKRSNDKERFSAMEYLPSFINILYADLKWSIDRFYNYKFLRKRFKRRMGYDLNLENPRSWSEKIIWKKIYDRNPLLTLTADKITVRSYLVHKLGKEEAAKISVPIYHITKDPDKIPFDELPERFVIKPNHGSNMHIMVRDNKQELKDSIISSCKKWLNTDHGIYHYEWAYRDIDRKILIEKLLEKKNNDLPMDFKLYCFRGRCKIIRVAVNRLIDAENRTEALHYDSEWNLIEVTNPGYKVSGTIFKKPCNFDEILMIGEKLSEDFDAVRVDLYLLGKHIYFSELTHYDKSGLTPYIPESFEFDLGSHWKIEPDYWKKSN